MAPPLPTNYTDVAATQWSAALVCGGMEVRILALDPAEESRDAGVGATRREVAANPRQCDIGKSRVQCSMANRVERHHLPAAAAPGHRMVIFDSLAERPGTEPALGRAIVDHTGSYRVRRLNRSNFRFKSVM